MYSGVPCFWLEPTGMVRLQLRRFTFSGRGRDCPAHEYGHDAHVDLDEERALETYVDAHGWRMMRSIPEDEQPGRDDPRWPTVCARCGEPFVDDDVWQVNQLELYVRSDTCERVAFRGHGDERFAGALFDAWWLKGACGAVQARAVAGVDGAKPDMIGPDGLALVAICPNGAAWTIDGPATGGGRWTRTGDPRQPQTLSVTPSIVAGDYHGFLTGGRFTDG